MRFKRVACGGELEMFNEGVRFSEIASIPLITERVRLRVERFKR